MIGILRLLKKVIYPLGGLSVSNRVINIYKTFIFNLLAFGLKDFWRFPIYIYTNTNIYKVGDIHIHCPLRRGMVRIGLQDYKSQGKTKFYNSGRIDIYGPVYILGATIVENSGNIIFKGYDRIGDGSFVFIRSKLEIGEYTRIGFHSFIFDSDDHFVIEIDTKSVPVNRKGIKIGSYNWIGNRTFIKKGVKTPDYLIVASSNTLLTKDYTSLSPYSVLGGCPAKLLKSGVRRIYDIKVEQELNAYFRNHKDVNYYQFEIDDDDLDEFCQQKGMIF